MLLGTHFHTQTIPRFLIRFNFIDLFMNHFIQIPFKFPVLYFLSVRLHTDMILLKRNIVEKIRIHHRHTITCFSKWRAVDQFKLCYKNRATFIASVFCFVWFFSTFNCRSVDKCIQIFCTNDHASIFFFFFMFPVQENAEQGADAPFRDEQIWQPGVRVHLQHLPR